MYKARHLLFILLISLGTLFVLQGDSYAGCDGWFSFSSTCNVTPPYCNDGSCTLSGGVDVVNRALGGTITDKPLSIFVQDIVRYLLGFVSLIAIIYIIYAGFQVMIGGGDEEKAKKAKNIILYVIVGITIMWLAYAIVNWTLELLKRGGNTSYNWLSIPETNAAYTENELDTFAEYQNKLRIAIENIEGELKINRAANVASLQNLKTIVQAAFDRLPDVGDDGAENDRAKRSVDIDIEVAIRNPTSVSLVGAALSKVSTFISSAKINTITGDISANPTEGNAPLITSFRATDVKDPSGNNPDSQNYIWWMRGNGGRRTEVGRGPSLNYSFTQEGTFTVFLDVVSSSRNSKGKIDVLPLSVSKQIEVKPKLGEIILLVNGVNVSNLSNLKISPNIGKMGILLDATASRAVGNGSITETTWDFGNGNTISYKGNPILERQLYINQANYPVKLTIKTNTNQTFTKELQLVIRDPVAVIQVANPIGHVGESMNFSSLSYFTTQSNIEYSWQIQNEDNKKILKSAVGPTLTHKFDTIGSYIVTLTSRNPNGSVDTDSRIVTVESREPFVNLAIPAPQSSEKPNIILFDASKSYDPDTMSRKGLTFIWRLNGEKIILDGNEQDGSRGTLKFDKTGTNTISLTVANAYGKVTTVEKVFEVTSVLAINMVVTPEVAPIGTTVNFIAQSENGGFFEWNMADGSAPINGSRKVVQHTFNKTGIYRVNLTVKSKDGTTTNQTSKTIYATDTNSPFANITASNGSNSVYEDSTACKDGAIVINRSESTNFDGSRSLNVDGSTSGLSYTWEYFGKIKTIPYITEKFSELGCFPIKLTVRNSLNGATHSSTRYVSLRNQPPELTSLTTSVDTAKKDAQKVLVRVTANGARDPDGVITSYIWYYTTESDKEPQNVQITQKNEITFVLPNITEKYYFGVIIEDNDGGRKNSIDNSVEQTPLLIDNENGNIYLPLISLSVPKVGLAGEKIRMSAEAKTILGTDITSKAEYSWDIDGDGKIDQKTQSPSVEHTYKSSGIYSVKVRVTNNGVSNTKYQTITIKNPLKAGFYGYKLANGDIYLLNASKGPYDKVAWNIGGETTESLYSLKIAANKVPAGTTIGKLTISSLENDTDTVDIEMKDVRDMTGSGVSYQSSPLAVDNNIHISGPGEKVLISLVGNTATRYVIDEDTSIDSDMDGVTDNDADNKDTPSYTDGSVFSFQDFSITGNKNRKVKLSLYDGNTISHTETITFIFDYINDNSSVSGEGLISLNSEGLSTFDRKELDNLATLIRGTTDENRIILMRDYNTLIENWDDPFSKAKTLIDIQERIESLNLSSESHTAFVKSIDALLIGDAEATDDVTVAVKLIESLIPEASTNKVTILQKLDEIKSHPKLLAENKILGKDILKLVETDSTIETKYKIHIKNQLLIIVSGGQESVPQDEIETTQETGSIGVLGFIAGVVKIFLLMLGIILIVILIGYALYRISRKNNDTGFQDFLIDSVFHSKKSQSEPTIQANTIPTTVVPSNNENVIIQSPTIDPLTSYIPPTNDPLSQHEDAGDSTADSSTSPIDNLPIAQSTEETLLIPSSEEPQNNIPEQQEALVPDWLKAPQIEETPPPSTTTETITEEVPANTVEPEELIVAPTIEETHITIEAKEDTPEDILIVKEETPEDVLLVKQEEPISTEPIFKVEMTPSEDGTTDASTNTPSADTGIKDALIGTPAPAPMERDPNMPDWLALDPTPVAIVSEETTPKEEVSISPAKNENNASKEALPDWLIESVKSSETVVNEGEENAGGLLDMIESDVPKKPKKPKARKGKEETPPATGAPSDTQAPQDNIPDWLK